MRLHIVMYSHMLYTIIIVFDEFSSVSHDVKTNKNVKLNDKGVKDMFVIDDSAYAINKLLTDLLYFYEIVF